MGRKTPEIEAVVEWLVGLVRREGCTAGALEHMVPAEVLVAVEDTGFIFRSRHGQDFIVMVAKMPQGEPTHG